MQQRSFSDQNISVLCLGSMRFDPKRIDEGMAQHLLSVLVDGGMRAVHTSHEYSNHDYFTTQLRRYKAAQPGRRFQHIVKLGEPHFDSTRFKPERFRLLVEQQLQALNTDKIDVLQWLLRHSPNEDRFRIPILSESWEEFGLISQTLIQEGKIGTVGCYPYSVSFARRAFKHPQIAGWVSHLNLHELELIPFLEKPMLAIRPFAAGRIFSDQNLWERVEGHPFCQGRARAEIAALYPLLHPSVATVITSISTIAHAEELLGILQNPMKSIQIFKELTALIAK